MKTCRTIRFEDTSFYAANTHMILSIVPAHHFRRSVLEFVHYPGRASPPMSPSTVCLSPEEQAEGIAGLDAALRGWNATKGSNNEEPPDWLPQMRCLVQAGVPKVCPTP